MFSSVAMTAEAQRVLLAATERALPREMCAVLGGSFGNAPRIDCVIEVANVADGDDAFSVEPHEFARATAHLQGRGRELLGFAHSHPRGTAQPSVRDRRELWPNYVQMIVAGNTGATPRMRAFELFADGRINHLALRVESGAHQQQEHAR